jgi:hypothetical protein
MSIAFGDRRRFTLSGRHATGHHLDNIVVLASLVRST